MEPERQKAATPSLEDMESSVLDVSTSTLSGYDGDKEDEGESFLDFPGSVFSQYVIFSGPKHCNEYCNYYYWNCFVDFSDDLATLWCTDLVQLTSNKHSLETPMSPRILRHQSPAAKNGVQKLNLNSVQNAQNETPQGHSGLMSLIHAINSQSQPSTTSQLGFSVYYDPQRRQSLPRSKSAQKGSAPLVSLQNRTEAATQVKPRKRKNSQQLGNENKVIIHN